MIELYGKKLENFDDLPVLSETIIKLLALLDDINSTNKQIARIISLDVVLSAKIISLANSPLYASNKPVNDVLQAIMKLGRAEIKNMVMTIKFSGALKKIQLKNINLDMFWKHSLATAFLSNKLMKEYLDKKYYKAEQQSSFYIAGLLHDIGLLIFDILDPDKLEKLEKIASKEKKNIADVELDETKYIHSKEGEKLLKEMGLPESISYPVGYHHNFGDSSGYDGISAIVNISDVFANQFGYYPLESETYTQNIDEPINLTSLSDLSDEDFKIAYKELKSATEMFISFAGMMLGKQ